MKNQYKSRYGLSSEQVMILKSKFRKIKDSGATDWKDLDDFCKWSAKEGYKPGMRIKKQYPFLPHSMENSYFVNTGDPDGERHATYIDAESPFCEKCEVKDCATKDFGCKMWRKYFVKNWKDCATKDFGCKMWRKYFVKNWDENICRKDRPQPRPADVVFRYEHPDLVREGIVWAGS